MNLELRRQAWEAINPELVGAPESTVAAFPPIELDTGIALDALTKFCADTDWFFSLTNSYLSSDMPFAIRMYSRDHAQQFLVVGATTAGVCCRAIVTAKGEAK